MRNYIQSRRALFVLSSNSNLLDAKLSENIKKYIINKNNQTQWEIKIKTVIGKIQGILKKEKDFFKPDLLDPTSTYARLIFLNPTDFNAFIDYLKTRYKIKGDEKTQQLLNELPQYKESLYLLHGKLFKITITTPTTQITLEMGFSLPISFFARNDDSSLSDAITFLINDIKHLIYDEEAQVIQKPNDTWNWTTETIDTIQKFDVFYEKLITTDKPVCIDTETENLNKFNNKILTMHFSLTGNEAYNIPFLHPETPFCSQELEYIKQKIKNYFETNTKTPYLIFHNAKFDLAVFKGTFGVEYFKHKIYDTMSGCYAIDENRKNITSIFKELRYGLGYLAKEYGCLAYEEGNLGKTDRENMIEHNLKDIMEYASKDVVIPYKIHEYQIQEAQLIGYTKEEYLNLVLNVLGSTSKVFVTIEGNGILLDVPYITSLLQSNGVLHTLENGLYDWFKISESCKKTNEIMHINKIILENINKFQKTIKKLIKVNSKQPPDVFADLSDKKIDFKIYYDKIGYIIKMGENIIKRLDILLKPNSILKKGFNYQKNLKKKELKEDIEYIKEFKLQIKNIKTSLKPEITAILKELLAQYVLSYECYEKYKKTPEFKQQEQNWIFDISKPETQQILFFDVLKLNSKEGKSGRQAVNTEFQEENIKVPEVQKLDEINKLKKTISANIQGIYDQLIQSEDKDIRKNRINSSYGFIDVVTGRSNSRSPNLQNITARSLYSNLIRRQFITQKGYMFIHSDLNASEIRGLANLADDENLKERFVLGMKLRRQLMFEKDPQKIEEIQQTIKDKGDIHRTHYRMFHGLKETDPVTKEQRQSVKGLVFGLVYGRSATTFAKEVNITKEQAEELFKKFYLHYPKSKQYIFSQVQQAKDNLYVQNPLGLRRRLGAILSNDEHKKFQATNTQSKNSPVQSFSSNLVYKSHELLESILYKLKQLGWGIQMQDIMIENTVHDSLEGECKIHLIPLCIYLQHIIYSYLIKLALKEQFNYNMILSPELECDIGLCMSEFSEVQWNNLYNQVKDYLYESSTLYDQNKQNQKVEAEIQNNLKTYSNISENIIKEVTKKYMQPLNIEYTQEEINDILNKLQNNYNVINEVWNQESKEYIENLKETTFLLDINKIKEIGEKLMF